MLETGMADTVEIVGFQTAKFVKEAGEPAGLRGLKKRLCIVAVEGLNKTHQPVGRQKHM